MCKHMLLSVVVGTIVLPAILVSQSLSQPSGETIGIIRIDPGRERPDGLYSAGTFHRYHVGSAEYLQQSLLIKTRTPVDAGKDGTGLLAGALGIMLRHYGVTTIRAPFADLVEDRTLHADRYGLGRMYHITFAAPADILKLCDRLNELDQVEYAEPIFIRRTTGTPDDPRISEQYALARVEAANAWDLSEGDSSVTIAILDSGVDWMHEDLADNIWINPNEIPDNKIDDDNNGLVDDVRGWDFVGQVPVQLAHAGVFLEDNDPRIPAGLAPNDSRHHGTHCAGVAGAVTNNGKGIAGMGFRSRLIPVKLGSDENGSNIYRGYEGIMYAAKLGADIISCSWGGGPYSQAEQDVIDQVTDMGSLVVAAAGNNALNVDNFRHYPASYRNVLSVGATDNEDGSALFSNYGITTSVFAPGVNILSTIGGDDRYDAEWSGTSMATPLVSGLAALLTSAHPDWTPGQIAGQIRSSVDDVIVADTLDRPRYFGRVNARRALSMNRTGIDTSAVPAIDIIETGIRATNGIITTNDETQVRLTLRNHHGTARNLRVTLIPIGDDVVVSPASASIDSLGSQNTVDVDLGLTVTGHTNWFEGTADVLVRFDAPGYVEYELVQVPYRFPSDNSYTLLVSGLPGKTEARAGHAAPMGVFWGVGEVPGLGGGFIRFFGINYNYNFVGPDPLTTVYAFDLMTAFVGSGSTVASTINGGGGWRMTPVATITPQIQNIHYFGSTEGIFIGNPLNGLWGIGITIDRGMSWSPISATPVAEENEEVHNSAITWRDLHGWFGTTRGRLFRTTNRGTSWQVSELSDDNEIVHVSFVTKQRGVLIYRDHAEAGQPMKLASTTDGGATWQSTGGRADTDGMIPVHLSAPGEKGVHVMLGKDGRIMLSRDNGATWTTEATSKSNAHITAGATSFDDAMIRVYSLGTSIGHLDIPFVASSAPVRAESSSLPFDIRSIHPNPSAGSVTLDVALSQRAAVQIELVNGTGDVVLRHDAGMLTQGISAVVLDVAMLPVGGYLCRITADNRTQTRLLSVQR